MLFLPLVLCVLHLSLVLDRLGPGRHLPVLARRRFVACVFIVGALVVDVVPRKPCYSTGIDLGIPPSAVLVGIPASFLGGSSSPSAF